VGCRLGTIQHRHSMALGMGGIPHNNVANVVL
jgi:hypothetical protein